MEKKFEELSVRALSLADAELARIAETETLDPEQNLRLTQRVLEKAGIQPEETVQNAKSVCCSKKRIRLLGVLIAAVIAVFALGIGVSGWLTYNKPLMESYFGTIGDERLQELMLPDPQTFSNGIVKATVEASMRDSNIMLVLMTFESADENKPINWAKLMDHEARYHDDNLFIYSPEILDENGEPVGTPENPAKDVLGSSGGVFRYENHNTVASAEFRLEIMNPDLDADAITLRFENQGQGSLDVTVPVTPPLESVVFEAENGKQMTLSPIWFRTSVAEFVTSFDDSWHNILLNRSDGTQTKGYLNHLGSRGYHGTDGKWSYSESMIYEVTEGMEFDRDKPETYNGFLDISNIESVEWHGMIYHRID